MAITSIEKKYPQWIFHTSSNQKYTVDYVPDADTYWSVLVYTNTRGNRSTNIPPALSKYHEFFDALQHCWYDSSKKYFCVLDSISSMPNFDMEHFSKWNYDRFVGDMCELATPKQMIKLYQQYGEDVFDSQFRDTTIIPTFYSLTEEETVFYQTKFAPNAPYDCKTRFLKDKKYRNLIFKAMQSPATYFMNMSLVCRVANDFMQNCELLEIKVPTGDFWTNAKNVRETIEQQKAEKSARIFKHTQTEHNLNFEGEKFIIVVPTSYEECRDEGAYMHNCMGGLEWDTYLSQGKRRVVFIRRKDNPKVPYVDMDMTLDFDIIQTRTQYNRTGWEKDFDFRNFLEAYKAYLKTLA